MLTNQYIYIIFLQRPTEEEDLFNSPDLTCRELSILNQDNEDSFLTPKRRKKVVFRIQDDTDEDENTTTQTGNEENEYKDSDDEEEDDSDYSGMTKSDDRNSSSNSSSSSDSDSASDAESDYYDTHSSDKEVSSDEPESEWVCILLYICIYLIFNLMTCKLCHSLFPLGDQCSRFLFYFIYFLMFI